MPITSRTFRSGNSDAVRLPKEVSFGPGVEIEIERKGDVVTLRPVQMSMKDVVARLRTLPKPSTAEVREPIQFPERPGL